MLVNIEKIKFSIYEIGIFHGKILKIYLSNKIAKDQLQEVKRIIGFECLQMELGYYSFMINYKSKDNENRYAYYL